jgi:TRAP-type C4-dicarboxylate transport system permease large subunit
VVAVIYSASLGGFNYRSPKWKAFPKILYETARLAAVSLFCIGTASAFGWLLASYRVPQTWVNAVAAWGSGPISVGLLIAGAFLLIGMFIDAIPAIIILGTILFPVAQKVGIHPIHFAIIGVISLAFGLVTPPDGLGLLISAEIGGVKVVKVLKDVVVILIPMLFLLLLVILWPDLVLGLPRLIAPQFG